MRSQINLQSTSDRYIPRVSKGMPYTKQSHFFHIKKKLKIDVLIIQQALTNNTQRIRTKNQDQNQDRI